MRDCSETFSLICEPVWHEKVRFIESNITFARDMQSCATDWFLTTSCLGESGMSRTTEEPKPATTSHSTVSFLVLVASSSATRGLSPLPALAGLTSRLECVQGDRSLGLLEGDHSRQLESLDDGRGHFGVEGGASRHGLNFPSNLLGGERLADRETTRLKCGGLPTRLNSCTAMHCVFKRLSACDMYGCADGTSMFIIEVRTYARSMSDASSDEPHDWELARKHDGISVSTGNSHGHRNLSDGFSGTPGDSACSCNPGTARMRCSDMCSIEFSPALNSDNFTA